MIAKVIPLLFLCSLSLWAADGWAAVEKCHCSDAAEKIIYPFYSSEKPVEIDFGKVTRIGYCTELSDNNSSITFENLDAGKGLLQKAHKYRAKVDLTFTLPADIGKKEEKTDFAIDNLVYNIGKAVSRHHFDGVTLDLTLMVEDSLSKNYCNTVIYALMKRLKKSEQNQKLYLNLIIPDSFSGDEPFFTTLKNVEDFVDYIFIDISDTTSPDSLMELVPIRSNISLQKVVPLLSQKELLTQMKENRNIGGVALRGKAEKSDPKASDQKNEPTNSKASEVVAVPTEPSDSGTAAASVEAGGESSISSKEYSDTLAEKNKEKSAAEARKPVPETSSGQKPELLSFGPVNQKLLKASYTLYYGGAEGGVNSFMKGLICPNRIIYSTILYLLITLYLTTLLVAFFHCRTGHFVGKYQNLFLGGGILLALFFFLLLIYDSVGNLPRYLILTTLILFLITYLIRLDSDRKMSRNNP